MNGKIVPEMSRPKEMPFFFYIFIHFLRHLEEHDIVFQVHLQIYKSQVLKLWNEKLEIELPVSFWSISWYLEGNLCHIS